MKLLQPTNPLLTLIMLLFANTFLSAQNAFMPPDYFPDQSPSQSLRLYPNDGQLINTVNDLVPKVKYYHLSGINPLYLMDDKIAFTQFVPAVSKSNPDTLLRIDMLPYKSETEPTPTAYYQSSDHVNFYYPHCSEGVTDVHGYDRIVYENYFEDIDLHVTSNSTWHKFFFVLHPNADANDLELEFQGQDQIAIVNNALQLSLNQRNFEIPQATAYQCNANGNITSSSWLPSFVNAGNGIVQFNVGSYNTSEYLILEFAFPVVTNSAPPFNGNLKWSTFYGGNNSDIGQDVRTDAQNNVYKSGDTRSTNFPSTIATVTSTSISNGFVTKFDDGTYRQWSTFFGGSKNEELYKLVVLNNHIVTAGRSTSTNAPINDSGLGYYATSNATSGSGDIHILKLDKSNGTLIHGTYLGNGGFANNLIGDIELDNNSNIYITGRKTIPLWGNNNSNLGDGFIAKLDEDLVPIWSTMLGTSSGSQFFPTAIAINSSGDMIIGGNCSDNTLTPQLHPNNANSYNSAYGGGIQDAFLMNLSSNSNTIQWATYLGGSDFERLEDIEIDLSDNILVCGQTESSDFYTYSTSPFLSTSLNGDSDGFISKFSSTGGEINSSYIGSTTDGSVNAITLDYLGNAYYTGFAEGGISTIPYPGNYYSSNAISPLIGDAFILLMNTINSPDWITYFGGNSNDVGLGITISDNHYLYLVGQSGSNSSFPWRDPLPNDQSNWYVNTLSNIGDVFISKFLLDHLVNVNTIKETEKEIFEVIPSISKTGLFSIRLKQNISSQIYIVNSLGQVLKEKEVNPNETEVNLNLSGLPVGVYFIHIQFQNKLQTQKIIISK